jgi:hypothetical protein
MLELTNLKNKTFISKTFLFILSFFLIIFPKGGIKLFSIPITWGYFFLALTGLLFLIRRVYILNINHIKVLIGLSFFQVISLYSFVINGIENIPFAISFLVSFFFLPYIFFLVLSEYIAKIDFHLFFKILKNGLFFVAAYGIFLFFYKLITKSFIEIPLLTTNLNDLGLLETKHIDRGTVFKLIATYNNGNLYGVSILMFLSLYNLLEEKFYKRFTVKMSLILSFSRTVWIAFLFSEILHSVFIKQKKRFFILIVFFIFSMIALGLYFDFSLTWFLDTTLGGRIKQFEIFNDLSFLPTKPFSIIGEIIYLGIMENLGILGLIFFLVAMTSPLVIYFLKHLKNISPIPKTIAIGLITYLFASLGDGGILLIPVMAFYWFLSAFLLSINERVSITFSKKT